MIERGYDKTRTLAVSKDWMPASYLIDVDEIPDAYMHMISTHATLMCLIASSSPKTQSCHSVDPYCIVPRIILETLRPEFPRRTAKYTSVRSSQIND